MAWMLIAVGGVYRNLRGPKFEAQTWRALEPYPKLTAVIPACNEEATLEPAVRSLLAQDYPNLEIVLINDRSTDGTGAIIDRLADSDARVVPLHIDELPVDWLGKVHAMHRGTTVATGEWILFADADVCYEPAALRNTVAFAETHAFDHVSLIPRLVRRGMLHNIMLDTFGTALLLTVPLHSVSDPDSDAFFGVGAFNLVRRSAWARTEGFAWLRMEIADDMALGLMLQRSGARTFAGAAQDTLTLEWYESATAMVRGLEKNLYAVMGRFSPLRATAVALGAMLIGVLPVAGFALPAPFGWPLSLAATCALAVLGAVTAWRWHTSPFSMLFLPVGLLGMGGALLRSMLSYLRNGGAIWRGTLYPTERLRELQRLKW